MKKFNRIWMWMAIATASFSFTSCDDDDYWHDDYYWYDDYNHGGWEWNQGDWNNGSNGSQDDLPAVGGSDSYRRLERLCDAL